VNINEQMSELAATGGLAYAPSDDTIADLLVGIGAAQAYSAAKDDPAFRDRNMINSKDGLTPIELYCAKFGADNPTRTYESQVDLSSIIANLKAVAQADPKPPAATNVQPASSGASGSTGSPSGTTAVDPYAHCKADHPDKPYEYYDCTKQQRIVKDG